MAERPILLRGPDVRAILEGRKTQARRLAKFVERDGNGWHIRACGGGAWTDNDKDVPEIAVDFIPYEIGDRLWVRETWAYWPIVDEKDRTEGLIYRATDDDWECRMFDWRASIHMPRWASRITLEVTGVRVERLQDISEEDAQAEGVQPWTGALQSYRADFCRIWSDLHGPGAWGANPWVVVLEFRRFKDVL